MNIDTKNNPESGQLAAAPSSIRFSYVAYDEMSQHIQLAFKRLFEEIETLLEQALPNSRPKSLVLTSLEEAYMWVGKAVRDAQIERKKKVDEQPGRCNE